MFNGYVLCFFVVAFSPTVCSHPIELIDSGQTLGQNRSWSVALGDLNDDGSLDAAVANLSGKDIVWMNDGKGFFTSTEQGIGGLDFNFSVVLEDVDADGSLDAAITGNYGTKIWLNDGSGTLTNSGQTLGDSTARSVAFGDLDGDGDRDAMIANASPISTMSFNTVWTNDGSGLFTNSGQELGSSNSWSVALGDLDGDGHLDAWVANRANQPNAVWMNDGTGTFEKSEQELGNNQSWSVALGDLDGDDDLDAFIANRSGQSNTVWINDGSAHFTNSKQDLGNSDSYSVALGDLDCDGDLDALIANDGANTLWINQGGANFDQDDQTFGEADTRSCGLGDFDGDGTLDAWFANHGAPNTVWMTQGRDGDSDGVSDCLDACPDDPLKTEPGACGCGISEVDSDGDGTPDCKDCGPSDLDGDGVVDGADLTLILSLWGTSTRLADLNGDGIVGGADLTVLLSDWGGCD